MLASQESCPRIYTQKNLTDEIKVYIKFSIIIKYTKIMATTSLRVRPPVFLL